MKILENLKQIEIVKKEFNDCAMLVKRQQLVEWLDELCKLEAGLDSIEDVGEVLCDSDNSTPLVKYVYSVLSGEEAEEVLDFILDSDLFKNVMEEQVEKMRTIARENFTNDEYITVADDEYITVAEWNNYCDSVNYTEDYIYNINDYGLETGHKSDFIDYDEYMDWLFNDFEKMLEYYY